MSRDTKKPGGLSAAATALGALLALALVYVLSIGPAVALYHKLNAGPATGRALEVIYAPIIWLGDNTALGGPLEAYVEWWLKLFNAP